MLSALRAKSSKPRKSVLAIKKFAPINSPLSAKLVENLMQTSGGEATRANRDL